MFFFQAGNGIRVDLVTGFQTCALPISPARRHLMRQIDVPVRAPLAAAIEQRRQHPHRHRRCLLPVHRLLPVERSEERRVGKEGRYRWSPSH